MRKIVAIFVGLIAVLHLYIAWFEIFAWESRGPAVFSTFPAELFGQTTAIAANQGLYNAFLAAGLVWALFIRDAKWKVNVATSFLIFVAVAGLFGAYTVSLRIFFLQAVPAVVTLLLLHFIPASAANEQRS